MGNQCVNHALCNSHLARSKTPLGSQIDLMHKVCVYNVKVYIATVATFENEHDHVEFSNNEVRCLKI